MDAPRDGDAAARPLRSLLVVGTGLIGTSIALAARAAGVDVWVTDASERNRDVAVALGAGSPWRPGATDQLDHAVVAVPPALVVATVLRLHQLTAASSISDTGAYKTDVVLQIESSQASASDGWCEFVGGHPMAGRERSGPFAARADLFAGRPWVLTPTARTSPAALEMARNLATCCGAVVVERTPADHDRAVALVSHVPQIVASALAAVLDSAPADDLVLSGQGVRDLTRIASSDPDLWADILTGNAAAITGHLRSLLLELSAVSDALEVAAGERDPGEGSFSSQLSRASERSQERSREPSHSPVPQDEQASLRRPAALAERDGPASRSVRDAVAEILRRGQHGRDRLPGKHGGRARSFTPVSVVVRDRVGELHALFGKLAEAKVNVEDLVIDHTPGQPAGVVELAVTGEAASRAVNALREAGWEAHVES